MANFQYANNPQTTLTGSVTAGASAITVASAADFPEQGKFTIIIDSEILLVTGVAGTTWTVQRGYDGTAAAAHNNNATVTGILTKASFLDAHHFDVRTYGAKGDGITNDSAAIQAAIDAAEDAGGGVVVLPPNATFLCSGLTITADGVSFRGGGATTVLKYNGSTNGILLHATAHRVHIEDLTALDNGIMTNAVISLNLSGTTKVEDCMARNLRVVCTNAASRGIALGYSTRGVIEACYAENLATTGTETESFGIYLHSKSGVGDSEFPSVRHCRTNGWYYGISSDGTGQRLSARIESNVVTNAINVGIWGYHATNGHITNNTVTDSGQGIFADVIEGVVAHNRVYNSIIGIRLEQLQYGACSNNVVHGNTTAGIVVGGGCFGALIDSNGCFENGIGILVDRTLTPVTFIPYEISITNNVCRRSSTHGIQAAGVYRSLRISGNTVTDNNTSSQSAGSGIRIATDPNASACQIVTITDNILGNNITAPSGGGTPGDQRYGIYVTDGDAVLIMVSGNYFHGNVTAGIFNSATVKPTLYISGNYLQTDSITTSTLNIYANNANTARRLSKRHSHSIAAGPVTETATVTWPEGGFGDTSYTVNVTLEGQTGSGGIFAWVSARTATTVNVDIRNATGIAENLTLHVVGFHD